MATPLRLDFEDDPHKSSEVAVRPSFEAATSAPRPPSQPKIETEKDLVTFTDARGNLHVIDRTEVVAMYSKPDSLDIWLGQAFLTIELANSKDVATEIQEGWSGRLKLNLPNSHYYFAFRGVVTIYHRENVIEVIVASAENARIIMTTTTAEVAGTTVRQMSQHWQAYKQRQARSQTGR